MQWKWVFTTIILPLLCWRIETAVILPLNVTITNTSQINISNPLVLPSFKDENIVFSYHFMGRPLPGNLVSALCEITRQRILSNVRLRPNDDIQGGLFKYQPDSKPIEITVEADIDKALTWRILDQVLVGLSVDRWSQHFFLEFTFDFELPPFEESYGRGSVRYLS